MSCRGMGMGGEFLFCGVMVAGFLYSCGPNMVVGTIGSIGTGLLVIKDKINKVALETQLDANTSSIERENLSQKIKVLDENEQKNWRYFRKFSVSIIPFVGPFIAITHAD